ncbi:hypothetical protein DRN97_12700 [Methanosarcinales archaeon]|nr:MAG: hypothetical protein DRN97_12700 [Methanosarcinales archaeon]
MIGVIYPDKYAVEETFQLMKIPWEWYDPSEGYDVVIGREEDLELVAFQKMIFSKRLVIC